MTNGGKILIAGAGIGGLTLACALRGRGMRVELIEKSMAWEAIGAGLLVQGNGMRVLRMLGLDAAVAAAGATVDRWRFAGESNAPLCETDLATLWAGVGQCIGIARAELQRILRDGADTGCRLGTTVASLDQDAVGVDVRFSDGSRGTYDLVVGADGISSGVRALAFGTPGAQYSGQMVWRALAPSAIGEPGCLSFMLGDQAFFGLCPVGERSTYGFANATVPRFHDLLEGRLARLKERFAAFGAPASEFVDALESDGDIHCAPIEWLQDTPWRKGRVILIGDAAHASSPMMGQGGCLAMEDAWVLAQLLAEQPDIPHALDAYERRRMPRVRWVQEQSRIAGKFFGAPSAERNSRLRQSGDMLLRDRFGPLLEEP